MQTFREALHQRLLDRRQTLIMDICSIERLLAAEGFAVETCIAKKRRPSTTHYNNEAFTPSVDEPNIVTCGDPNNEPDLLVSIVGAG